MRHKALNPKQDGQEERIQSGRHQVPEQDLEEEQKSRERQPVDQLCGLPHPPSHCSPTSHGARHLLPPPALFQG